MAQHPLTVGDLQAAIRIGVQKINVGSGLKRVYFETLKNASAAIPAELQSI